jgi:2-methylisocitrate lyase-like PEP mutase family enzyme
MDSLTAAADSLRSLHRRADPVVLVNAWDVASAKRVAAAGATAVATSSAAMAATLGVTDDRSTPIELMFDAITRIAAAVDVPVSADLLDGYGLDGADLVDRLLAAGAVGCNLEDSDHEHPGSLVDADTAAARISAVRAAAARAGVDIVINARIDSYIHAGPGATPDVVARGRRYLDAGADCVYPVRLSEPRVAREVVEQLDAHVNANVAGDTTIADLAASGVSRISIGPMAFQATLDKLSQVAAELLAPAVGKRV